MNEQDIVNKLKSDPRALKSVMQSQDGQALLNMLSGGNSAALGQAARQAASGDTAALSAMLSRVLFCFLYVFVKGVVVFFLIFRRQVDDLLGLHLVDLAECHRQPSGLHISCGEETGHGGAL